MVALHTLKRSIKQTVGTSAMSGTQKTSWSAGPDLDVNKDA